jgi:hypothetical protein
VAAVRAEIDRRRRLDADRGAHLGLLGVRVRAVAEAQRATLDRAEGAAPALRQSLVDLAAVAEALADDLGVTRRR